MQEKLFQLLAGRRGHFRMESGYHSERWFDLDGLLARPDQVRPFITELARRLARHRVDAVCGPMTGGAKLAESIAAEIGVEYFFTDRFAPADVTGLFPVKYRVPAGRRSALVGKRVAIVDDAVSAGSAVRGTYADVIACGAEPVALGALFVFGYRAGEFAREKRMAIENIAQMAFGMWPPTACPLCVAGVPVENVSDAV